MKYSLQFRFVIAVLALAPSLTFGQTNNRRLLDDVINQALVKSERLQSLQKSIDSLESEIKSRDLELSARVDAQAITYKDVRQTATQLLEPRDATSNIYGLSLTKPFATGTELFINTSHRQLGEDRNNAERNTAEWQIRLSQSLWNNSFGRSTDLRRSADNYEKLSRKAGLELEKQNFLIEIESAFWDLALAENELQIRKKNVERSESLEKWSKNRVQQFAAEKTDLLQVQALLAQRKLDLAITENEIIAKKRQLAQLIPDLNIDQIILSVKDTENLTSDFKNKSQKKYLRLDALAAEQSAKRFQAESDRIDDSLKPNLDAFVSYTSNAIDERFDPAWDRSINEDNTDQRIGLSFSLLLDSESKDQQRKAARSNYEAMQLKAAAARRESEIAYDELLRSAGQIESQIKIAKQLFELQTQKLNLERIRYQQGRTTTLQITTFEVDAAESELRLYRLMTQYQKMISQFRLFNETENNL